MRNLATFFAVSLGGLRPCWNRDLEDLEYFLIITSIFLNEKYGWNYRLALSVISLTIRAVINEYGIMLNFSAKSPSLLIDFCRLKRFVVYHSHKFIV